MTTAAEIDLGTGEGVTNIECGQLFTVAEPQMPVEILDNVVAPGEDLTDRCIRIRLLGLVRELERNREPTALLEEGDTPRARQRRTSFELS